MSLISNRTPNPDLVTLHRLVVSGQGTVSAPAMVAPRWSPELLCCYPLPSPPFTAMPNIPTWVKAYRPKRLKRPKQGRVFQVPRQKGAMRDARTILWRLRLECAPLPPIQQTQYLQGVLRQICPFIFEELLLHCCQDRGWKVIRSCYTHDGGIDGTFFDPEGGKFLIQAKRYSGEIDPEHLLKFSEAVSRDKEAIGGVFMHTGSTCDLGYFFEEQLCNITLLEGCELREFVLQQP